MGLLDRLFGPPSKDVFAREMISALRAAGDRDDIVYERSQFRLVRPASKNVTDLGTLYAEHCALPRSERRAHIERLVQTVLIAQNELPEDFDEARPHLRPKIWCRAQLSNLGLRRRLEGGEELDVPLYPLGEHLLTSVVYDLPAAVRTLSNADLQRWNLTYYEALEAGCLNLEEATLPWTAIAEGVYSSLTGDNYDSARILLIDRIRDLALLSEPVALLPSRDSLLVTGSDDVDGLEILLELAEKLLAEDRRPLSGIPLRLVDGAWEDWLPPHEHPHHARFARLAEMFLGARYTEQQKLLNAIHHKDGINLFVASFSTVENPKTGQQRSYCVWGEGVDALLPQTQYVMLPTKFGSRGAGGGKIGGEWSRVRKIVGDLMQPVPDLYPPRWRVREFPSQEQLEQIGTVKL